jgi:hypothetical protein
MCYNPDSSMFREILKGQIVTGKYYSETASKKK